MSAPVDTASEIDALLGEDAPEAPAVEAQPEVAAEAAAPVAEPVVEAQPEPVAEAPAVEAQPEPAAPVVEPAPAPVEPAAPVVEAAAPVEAVVAEAPAAEPAPVEPPPVLTPAAEAALAPVIEAPAAAESADPMLDSFRAKLPGFDIERVPSELDALRARAEEARAALATARSAAEEAEEAYSIAQRELMAAECPPTLQELNAAALRMDEMGAEERLQMQNSLRALGFRVRRKANPHPLLFPAPAPAKK